ncbi:MAG TPA: hypoxanthine phosphoribosyltransferase, partial [Acidimicrobiaceae bacterium]|nr:hypoxanthine phosphoribosyltransferase [Acidimicrobiaceae bacterium]
DLIRAIDLPVEIDFMAVSSYGASTRSSGVVRIMKDLDVDITGRDVILVEDIVDSGLTLQYLRKSINARGPASLAVCALLLREEDAADAADGAGAPVNGVASTPIEYVGFRLPKVWVVGYGLDLDQRYRNLPDIRAFDEDH